MTEGGAGEVGGGRAAFITVRAGGASSRSLHLTSLDVTAMLYCIVLFCMRPGGGLGDKSRQSGGVLPSRGAFLQHGAKRLKTYHHKNPIAYVKTLSMIARVERCENKLTV